MACGGCVRTVVATLEARLGLVVQLTRRCRGSYFASTVRAFVSVVNMALVELGQGLASWLGA
jgi:hypothetical protein